MSGVVRASWYRFTATFRHELGSYVTIALLLGLIGGLAMGSLAAARRTQSSYSALLASSNPSQIVVATGIANPAIGNGQAYDAPLVREIAHFPHVTAAASAPGINAAPLGPNGGPRAAGPAFPVQAGSSQGSVGGEYFGHDSLAIGAGRAADPVRPDEFVISPASAAAYGFHVGEIVPMGFYTNRQTDSPGFGTAAVKPYRRIDMRLVGIGLPVTAIVTDDLDAGGALGYFTPALTRELLGCCANYTDTAIEVARPDQIAAVRGDIVRAFGGISPGFNATAADDAGKADRSLKPLSIALAVFGGITALAALLITVQVTGRYLRRRRPEAAVLRALGAEPTTVATDSLIGVVGSLAVGSLLAVGVAVALSLLSPLGPFRPYYPTPGVSFDWTVLAGGFAVLFVSLALAAVALAFRNSPERVARRQRVAVRSSALLRSDGMLGLPAPAVTGLRFALSSGSEVEAVPMRSSIIGAALAAIVLIGTYTFGASLNHLVSTPRLYGWNWNYALSGGGGGGGGNIPARPATALLAHDHYLSAYSPVYFVDLIVDGRDVPVLGENPGAAVQPPLLQGHDLQGSDQIVLGALTLASLHKALGDTVTVRSGTGRPHLLHIVGVATMPAIGNSDGAHLEMGIGAELASSLIPAVDRNPFGDPQTGPDAYLVDVRPGVNPVAARSSLEHMTAPLSNSYNFGVVVQPVLRPAEIVDYRSMGTTPAVLGAALGAGALAALGLTLLASVRRRRRDLAVLRVLGFTRSQLRAVVAWQSNVAVALGMIVGVPVGIAVGRSLWGLFAREINAVPFPVVPVVPILLIALGALVLANIVAAIPGLIAGRTPAALLLRAE